MNQKRDPPNKAQRLERVINGSPINVALDHYFCLSVSSVVLSVLPTVYTGSSLHQSGQALRFLDLINHNAAISRVFPLEAL